MIFSSDGLSNQIVHLGAHVVALILIILHLDLIPVHSLFENPAFLRN